MPSGASVSLLRALLAIQIVGTCVAFFIRPSAVGQLLQRRQYDAARNELIRGEQRMQLGSQQLQTAQEQLVDAYLKRLKREEFAAGIQRPAEYAPGKHFFEARSLIERSPVYRLLRQMPKGGNLHGHNSAMVSAAWLVQNITYIPGMLKCRTAEGQLMLSFRRAVWHQCAANYVLVADERAASGDWAAYDRRLEGELSLMTERPYVEFPDINTVWTRFDGIFKAISDVLTYERSFRLVYWRLMQEMYDDNVMYLEIRTGFTLIYYDDQRLVTEIDVLREVQQIVEDFKRSHPDFVGVKLIYSKSRNTDDVDNLISKYRVLKAEFPDLIVGFDLVGQEDVGKPLYNFIDKLLQNSDIDFMFHAGETDWSGFGSDLNMLDAVLLNSTRIGHGYSLYKHPILLDLVRRRRICLEVCPISNQVLGLVNDLRNHPAAVYAVLNVPMVIASDDPGFWGATGLSYDFYYALMSFTDVHTGLGYVKQLALNSLRYSRMTEQERGGAQQMFNRHWGRFLENVINVEGLQ